MNVEVTGPYEKVNAATKKAIKARDDLKLASDEVFDRAVEVGWELGVVAERGRVHEIINALKSGLKKDEKKALKTLDIVLTLVLDSQQSETD